EIRVEQAASRPGMLADEGEGGRLDLGRGDAEVLGDPAGEHGLAGSQVSGEEEDAVRRERAGDLAAGGDGLLFARGVKAPAAHLLGIRWSRRTAFPEHTPITPRRGAGRPRAGVRRDPMRA